MRTKEELLKSLEEINVTRLSIDNAFSNLLRVALDSGAEELVDDFVDYELLEILAKRRLEESGVWGEKIFLNGINSFNRNVFYIDGYDNARDVTKTDLVNLKCDLKIFINGL